MSTSLRYAATGLSVAVLEQELDRLWAELQTDSPLRQQARQAGIDVARIQSLRRAEAISISQQGGGLDPATTAIIVAFAPLAADIARDLWVHLLLPKIRRAKGADALPPKADERAPTH